jgi:DNA-binding transcriptional MerR regulator
MGANMIKTLTTAHDFKALQTTSVLCQSAGVTRGQLRLYEEAGLIAPHSRTEAGYRQYGSDTQDRLKAIRHLKDLGFSLAEIALLLSERDQGALDASAIQRLAGAVVAKIDERMAALQVIRAYVAPVALGDMRVLQDEDCNFVLTFLSALSGGPAQKRA